MAESISSDPKVNESSHETEVRSSSPMENPLVVRRILTCFSTKELLELSTVNKLWNYEARCLLRDHRECKVQISEPMPCETAKLLNDEMANLKVVPFNALSVEIYGHKCCTQNSVEEVFASFIDKLYLKELKIDWYGRGTIGCILGQLMLRFLSESPKLECLFITEIPQDVQLKIENQPNAQANSALPKLKILRLPYQDRWSRNRLSVTNPLIKELLTARAPNLRVLDNKVVPDELDLVPAGKTGIAIRKRIVKNITCDSRLQVNMKMLDDLHRFIETDPRLETVTIYQPSEFNHPDHQQRFWTLLWYLLRASSDSLEEAHMDRNSITMLMAGTASRGFDLLRFETVTQLVIIFPNDDETGVESSLLRLPMQNIFPSVTEVIVGVDFDVRAEALFELQVGERMPWLAVTKIKVLDFIRTSPLVRDLVPLFPSVDSMVFSGEPPFSCLWGNWPDLKYLHFGEDYGWELVDPYRTNYDAEFCGIYPAEAALLRQMDEEYLNAVNIVAPFPAINHLKGLWEVQVKLFISYKTFSHYDEDEVEAAGLEESLFLSKVTRFVALRHMKHLKFRLLVPSDTLDYFEHLEPWIELEGFCY